MNGSQDLNSKKWDVAISLLAEDEAYGCALENEIGKHVRGEVFLYSRQQEKIARDGELVELFTRVFDHEARVAVVIYRKGWGATPYTALEQDALRTRRLREGARGILIVTMDGEFPGSWYPADHFRMDPGEFTPEQIAAVVAERVKEAGGTLGPEPPVEKARRLAAERLQKERLAQLLEQGGGEAIEQEARKLFGLLRELAQQITRDGSEKMTYEERSRSCRINYGWGSLTCDWVRPYANSRDGSELTFSIKDTPTLFSGRHDFGEPRILEAGQMDIDLPEEGVWAWRFRKLNRKPPKQVVLTDELADWLINELLDKVSGEKPPPPRGRRMGSAG